ncbi:MAG: hypothetical protein IJF77_00905, partial [Alistipes sp.]|nr:hypothetical protein [Alistipes sp.]
NRRSNNESRSRKESGFFLRAKSKEERGERREESQACGAGLKSKGRIGVSMLPFMPINRA